MTAAKFPGALYPPPHAANKVTIKWHSAYVDVGVQYDDDEPGQRSYWVECIEIGGVWLGVAEVFLPSACAEMNRALDARREECAAERAAA
jgi:hypothetical protein